MKKICFALLGLTACTTVAGPNQYIANMYAKGTLNNYSDTGASCSENKNCPGCHVKSFDRVTLTVDEVLDNSSKFQNRKVVDGCKVSIIDSLHLQNISEQRYIPATPQYTCETVYEKEKSYLKAMGFAE